MSYYQKYRPQRVGDLDLVDVRDNFLDTLKSGSLAHAYLFVGPRGSGKTSAARILSQVVNCVGNKSKGLKEPCGKCTACLGIRKGSEVDVLEMDAASHRGIDDIRSLRERIKLAPVSLSKKVYIIDEVHMLTREAFNALLKVLEEPPAHVMFFLCTTEEHKVPETIISRCAKVAFTKATTREVEASLMKVVKGEKLKMKGPAVKLLAESVDGSFREGHKLLQQLGVSGKQIGVDEVSKILGLAGRDKIEELLKMSLSGNASGIGGALLRMEKKGVSAGSLLGDLLKVLQEMIREAVGKGNGEVSKKICLARLLIESAEKLKISPLPFLPIELALLEVGFEISGKEGGRVEEVKDERTTVKKLVKNIRPVKKPVEKKGALVKEAKKVVGSNSLSLNKIEEEWGKLLDKLSMKNRSVAGLLRASKPKVANGNSLTIEVFYEFHKNQLEQDSKRILVEQAAAELWGPMVLRCVLGERAKKEPAKREDRIIETKVEDEYVKSAEDVFGN